MAIKIYRDNDARSIFVENENGARFLNSLHAAVNPDNSGNVDIHDQVENVVIVYNTVYSEFMDASGAAYGVSSVSTVNALNSIFNASGTSSDNVPEITSSSSINITAGESINYELTSNYGVGYEWDNLPTGVTTVEGNIRKIIGGSNLPVGTYTPTMRAVNYNGQDSETLTITVASTPYSNTRSVVFNNNEYVDATATTSHPLYRAANGSGSGDAWTLMLWVKPGSSNNQNQTLLYFGGDTTSEAGVALHYKGNSDGIKLTYGSSFNYLQLVTPTNSLTVGSWHQIVVTYDGGTTGVASNAISNYYGRFQIWIDGVSQSTTNSHANYGNSSSVPADLFRIGRERTGQYLRNDTRIDEVAIWASDETTNVASIYNSGTPHDLTALGSSPAHYWRMGDGDTYPTLQDNVGSLDLTMNNMASNDISNDVPS